MSRTLSKILVVCALVVVLPLMVIGTAFAAYYSISATVSIEVFVDQNVNGGSAEVSYGDETGSISKALEVTDGHLKNVTFRASTVGYEFVGWYAGTYKAYAAALSDAENDMEKIEYAITTKEANVNMTDYQNLVAVFKAKTYDIVYNYQTAPNGSYTSATPASGKTTYVYGEEIVKPTYTEQGSEYWEFDGWYVDGDATNTKYEYANFQDDKVTLKGSWKESTQITVTYLDNNGNNIMVDGANMTAQAYSEHTFALANALDTATNYVSSYVEDGYAYAWQDSKGNEITTIKASGDVSVRLTRKAVNYSATVNSEDSEITLSDSVNASGTFTRSDKSLLKKWATASNWAPKYAFMSFSKLTYSYEGSSETVTGEITSASDVDALVETFMAAHPHDAATITFTAVVENDIELLSMAVSYRGETSASLNSDGKVYVKKSDGNYDGLQDQTLNSKVPSDMKLVVALGLTNNGNDNNEFYGSASGTNQVVLSMITITIGGTTKYYSITIDSDVTLSEFADYIFKKFDGVADKIEDNKLAVTMLVQFTSV
jgi:hypothetical protein